MLPRNVAWTANPVYRSATMLERADLLRVDATGMIHPLGKTASQALRARAGEWRLVEGPGDVILMRKAGGASVPGATLKLAGEIRTPGAMCDIVALIAQALWRGELVLVDDGSVRSVYFADGSVLGVATNVSEERLGETLYRAGALTREHLDATLAATKTGKRFGEAILELEFLKPEQLFPMMARQVEEVFYAVLQLSAGTFYFFDRFDDGAIGHRHNLNVSGLMMEGVRRMDEMRFFREKVPNDDYIPTPTSASAAKKPPEDLTAVFLECDGKRSIAEIGRTAGLLEFEVTRSVFQLINGGYLTVASPRPQGADAIVSVFNRALAAVHAACVSVGKVGDLREGLARFATGAGIYDPLFLGAGPLEDGTLRADRVAKNLAALAGDDPDAWLIQLMHEYVGFAMFQAESLMARDAERTLKDTVSEMLKPVRPLESSGPTSSMMRGESALSFGPSPPSLRG
jgi:hypothetical protein